jgi:hypothetical protein
MSSTLQHCPDCEEEYVAGVTSCVECGGPLQAGPLERFENRVAGPATSDLDGGVSASSLDRLLVELPGLQADHAVRALLAEDIAVRVVCRGSVKVYAPGQQPAEPFAVTLPVSVYVAAHHVAAAQEIIASFQEGDVIGDQWSAVEPGTAERDEASTVESDAVPVDADDDAASAVAPSSESTSLRTVVLLVVAGIILLFVFGR